MTAQTLTLVLIAGTLAAAFWLALVLLVITSNRTNHWLRRFGLMAVALNYALMWSYACLSRVYPMGDRLLVTAKWSRVTSGMLATYLLGYAWLMWRAARKQKLVDE